jgi:hypothetical protein
LPPSCDGDGSDCRFGCGCHHRGAVCRARQARLPAGTAGDAAIYTEHIKPSHIIRKVILRQFAIVNQVNPF